MGEVQLMHAGEEGLLILIPLAIVFYLDHRNRRKEKQRLAAAESGSAGLSAAETPGASAAETPGADAGAD